MSAAVTPLCSAGTSRKYQYHVTTHSRLPPPSATNDPRHETAPMRNATTGGVIELPMRENECVKPCASPRLAAGVQLCIARVATGNVAPSPTPSNRRTRYSVKKLPARPVSTVADAQTKPQTNSVRRAPHLSPIQPPKIWTIVYVIPKAPMIRPSWPVDKWRSLLMVPPAVARFCRATYVMRYMKHSRPRTTVGALGRLSDI